MGFGNTCGVFLLSSLQSQLLLYFTYLHVSWVVVVCGLRFAIWSLKFGYRSIDKSNVTCHTSHVTRRTSHVTRHTYVQTPLHLLRILNPELSSSVVGDNVPLAAETHVCIVPNAAVAAGSVAGSSSMSK